MPINVTAMSAQMVAKGTSLSLTGSKFSSIVQAVSMATSTYLLSAGQVSSTNICLGPGAGTFNGRISGLVPSVMANLMRIRATSMTLTGRDIGKLFNAVSFGVCNTIKSTAISQGIVVGAGPGTGKGRIIGLVPTALQPLIISQLAARTLVGSKMRQIVSAMSFGICNHIMTNGIIITTCIGAAAGPPAGPVTIPVAPGTGRLV